MSQRIKDLEEEVKSNQNSASQTFSTGNLQSTESYHPQIVSFKPIRENQLVSNQSVPTLNYANKVYNNNESTELLYKIFRGETRLVRSVLENNGFQHTESHDWNLLWSNSGCKTYLYEGLNEH